MIIKNFTNVKEVVKSENMNSESATNGQVLTANGQGGSSWQDGASVVANPQGEATASLTKITINGIVYSIEGGSAELDELMNEEF